MSTPAEIRAIADILESQQCTHLTALWCPVHGDCGCPRTEAGEPVTMDDPQCPLHRPGSSHAEEATA